MANLSVDTSILQKYSNSRRQFLLALGCGGSCRDPLAEFAERLACQHLSGNLALSRVQKSYDLITSIGRRVQVKYLANPGDVWRNEHTIIFSKEVDDYALVFFEEFNVRAMIVFRKEFISAVCTALKKRHPRQECELQLTQTNFKTIIDRAKEFEQLGVQCFLPLPQDRGAQNEG